MSNLIENYSTNNSHSEFLKTSALHYKNSISQKDICLELEKLLDKYEWFYSVNITDNQINVVVNELDKDIMKIVPETMYGHFIKIVYTDYVLCEEKYSKPIILSEPSDEEKQRFQWRNFERNDGHLFLQIGEGPIWICKTCKAILNGYEQNCDNPEDLWAELIFDGKTYSEEYEEFNTCEEAVEINKTWKL